ncbi:MAG: M23 family metallopeptidase [Anaerolineae bacterium]
MTLRRLLILMWALVVLHSTAQEPTQTAEPTPRPRPAPFLVLPLGTGGLELYFNSLTQGTMGLLRLASPNVTEAQAIFDGRAYPFFRPADEDALYALIVARIDMPPRAYPLQVLAALSDGTLQTQQTMIDVQAAGFLRVVFNVPSDRAFLINPEVERNEFARLGALTSRLNPLRQWDAGGFQLPMQSEMVSNFGQYRVLNNTVQTRHTGWDQRAATGTPVYAMARGVVNFAGMLDIRGNYVMIDHGWGIFSGYAHLSQMAVAPGQTVERGQLIGLSGNTGRSSGPHLHWEISVSGEWIDGFSLINGWLP